jgi:hypothetical protein
MACCSAPFTALFGVRGGVESVMDLSNSPARTADRQIRALIRPIEPDSEGNDLFRSAVDLQNRNWHSVSRLFSPLLLASSSQQRAGACAPPISIKADQGHKYTTGLSLIEKEPLASKYIERIPGREVGAHARNCGAQGAPTAKHSPTTPLSPLLAASSSGLALVRRLFLSRPFSYTV